MVMLSATTLGPSCDFSRLDPRALSVDRPSPGRSNYPDRTVVVVTTVVVVVVVVVVDMTADTRRATDSEALAPVAPVAVMSIR
jgi:hypothetical protein